MTLHVNIQGAGPDLALLHGWGLHSGVWDELLPELTARYRVHCIDLPGHGLSAWNPEIHALPQLAATIAPHVPTNAHVLGWSLGGIAALQLALTQPPRSLTLICSTPKFVANEDWPNGMRAAAFETFVARLRADFHKTVEDFLVLQVRGDLNGTATLRTLKSRLLQHPPQTEALHVGLEILRNTDLRSQLPGLRAPTLIVSGQHDRITPSAAGRYLAGALPQARWTEIRRAGHAPFISHREEFLREVDAFLSLDAAA